MNNELQHHGILGMKWGVRRYQNKDGTLTKAGIDHYRKLEVQAINRHYNEQKKNGGGFVFKSARRSTGKNFDEAEKQFQDSFKNDREYKELSKKAFDAEKKRLMAEKQYVNDDNAYDKYMNSAEAQKLMWDSIEAKEAKDTYVARKAEAYVDIIREAKLDDLGVTENREEVKQYLSRMFDNAYWDGNLDYNDDNYYDDWVEKEKFK